MLLVYPDRMQEASSYGRAGPLQRRRVALTQAGASREDSYTLVQRNAMRVWESDGQLSLLDLLKADQTSPRACRPNSSRNFSTSVIR